MRSYKARAIVLHTVKYGDSSVVAYLLTDTHGRQSYMVQGVRSKHGKGNKGSLLQPMFILDIEGIEPGGSHMHRIREMCNLTPLSAIPFDVRKSTISLFMAETIYKLVREVEPNATLFEFVYNAVQALDGMEDGVSNFHLWFLVRLSYYLGFYPGNAHLPGAWFDIREGVFTPFSPRHRLALDPDNAAVLACMINTPIGELGNIGLSRTRRSEFLSAMMTYFGFHLDSIHSIQSIQILKEVF